MAIRITTAAESGTKNGAKLLIYGPSGSGKTTLVGTFDEGSTAIITSEKGCMSINSKNTTVFEIETYEDLDCLLTAFKANAPGYERFLNVALDSISDIGEAILRSLKKSKKDARMAYGEFGDKIDDLLVGFRDLIGRNVLVIAKHEYDDKTCRNQPSMPWSKKSNDLPFLFDGVFALCVGDAADGTKFRYLKTQLEPQWVAKDRSRNLEPIEYVNDTDLGMPHIIAKMLPNNTLVPQTTVQGA